MGINSDKPQPRNRKSLLALISGIADFRKHFSLTLKMVAITVAVGIALWILFDIIQTDKLKKIFRTQLTEWLGNQAMEDRLNFDRYIKAHLHAVKLFISQKNFSEYIERLHWSKSDIIKVKHYTQSPEWFPKSSALHTFFQPRFALLIDAEGNLREVYSGMKSEPLPHALLHPSRELLLKSIRENFMTSMEGKPYLIASERYVDSGGEVLAILMFASPIEDVFLAFTSASSMHDHIVALLTPGENPRIMLSSNPDEIPVGASLETLQKQYLVTGKEFFDYRGSEQVIKFVSLISMKDINALIKSIVWSERQMRIMGLPLLTFSFALLMFWVTRRIQLLTRRISEFSQKTLGGQSADLQRGDQLYALEERFQRLTEEVLAARDVIKREAEERLLIEKKNMEIRQKEKELALLQTVTQAVGVGVIKKTAEGLEAVNRQMEQFAKMCGGLSKFDIRNAKDMECNIPDKNGSIRVFHIRGPEIFKEEKIFLVRDITKFKEQKEALEHMAMHDALTGLPNRALLLDRLQQAIFVGQREERSVALLMMDLDRFKEINDTLGHHIGDLVLKEVGDRLEKVLRRSDTFARLGGDEFAVVLPAADIKHAREAADKLLTAIKEPFRIEENNLYVGASIGIVFFPDHGNNASTLLQRADVAMYVAKNAQSGVAIYSPDHDRHSLQNLVMMGELRHAIENNGLSIYYQPKISFKTGCISGIETLVRWHHAQHGFIPPNKFIPIAERTGLIKPLTIWVISAALDQYDKWRKKRMQIKAGMSVNLSARNLLDSRFPEDVASLLGSRNISPSALELEITESAIMADPELAMKILRDLDHIGVRLSLDDFGTGYSSLSYLKQLPVDEIKIDKSFVINMAIDENDATIVRSTIDLAHNLGLKVIAEGVESQETWEMLKRLGCDNAQGYYICSPLPADEFMRWLSEKTSKKQLST